MPYRHIFFDLDHTLWDFDANSRNTVFHIYNQYGLQEKGISSFDEFYQVYHMHNERLWERFRNGFIKREELRWKRMWLTLLDFKIGNTQLAYELSGAYLELLPTQKALVPHAVEVLDHCKTKEYELHIITNGFEVTQWQKLHYCGISHYFKHLISSEKSNSIKPQRQIFDYALQLTGATTDECIMIGDALDIDIAGAMNAGWKQVYFNYAKLPHDKKPTYEICSLKELLNIL